MSRYERNSARGCEDVFEAAGTDPLPGLWGLASVANGAGVRSSSAVSTLRRREL